MQERQIRLLSEAGDLDKTTIQAASESNGWTLKVSTNNGDEHMLSPKRHEGARIFKTADACLRTCARLGIKNVIVTI